MTRHVTSPPASVLDHEVRVESVATPLKVVSGTETFHAYAVTVRSGDGRASSRFFKSVASSPAFGTSVVTVSGRVFTKRAVAMGTADSTTRV